MPVSSFIIYHYIITNNGGNISDRSIFLIQGAKGSATILQGRGSVGAARDLGWLMTQPPALKVGGS